MEKNRTGSTAVLAAVLSKFLFALAYLCFSARKNCERRNSSHPRCQRRCATLRRYGRKMPRIECWQCQRISLQRCGREARRSGDIILCSGGVTGAKSWRFAAEPATRSAQRRKARSLRGGRDSVQTLTPGAWVSLGFSARIVRAAMETIASSRWSSGKCFTNP